MNKITTINQLLAKLSESSAIELTNIFKQLDIPYSEFEPYIFWSELCYTRNCIIRTEDYELLLLCWKKNQITPIHSHNKQECWAYNIKGHFEEIRYSINEKGELIQTNEFNLNEGNFSYMYQQLDYHLLKNGNDRSITLHLYAKPIDECLIYNGANKTFETTQLTYHSLEGKLIT